MTARVRSGFDLVEVSRLRRVLERKPRLAERVLTSQERAYCAGQVDPVPSIAARWAAKEAAGKLLGTGILDWQEMEVIPGAPPRLRLTGETDVWARTLGIDEITLSLSHTKAVAAAVVIALARGCGGEEATEPVVGRLLPVEARPIGLRPDQVREMDRVAIDQLGVPGPILMERAALGVTELVLTRYAGRHTLFVCGRGNNGGDGLAAARQLHLAGHPVACVVAAPSLDVLSPDAALNLTMAQGAGVNLRMGDVPAYLWEETELIVDCLLGTGAGGDLRDPIASWADCIAREARRGCPVIAVDVPTGVDSETGAVAEGTVVADVTVTFHAPKAGILCPPGSEAAGELLVWDIGLPGFIEPPPDLRVVTGRDAAVPGRRADDHKYRAGFVAVLAGSGHYPGAAFLACKAAVRTGAGYVRLVTTPETAELLRGRLPEVPVSPAQPAEFAEAASDPRLGALVVGPGLGRNESVRAAVRQVLSAVDAPTVLDADGLLAFAGEPSALRDHPGIVLTPHAGELAELLGVPVSEVVRAALPAARDAARTTGQVVVLKGSATVIAVADGQTWVVTQGPPQLASAGTGDVLAGCIGALLAKGLSPIEAAKTGVWVHAEAGKRGAEAFPSGLAAEDVIALIPRVIAGRIIERRPSWAN